MIRKITGIGIIALLCIVSMIALTAAAESEPNNSLTDAQVIDEGTYTGEVRYNLLSDDDEDYFKVSIPADTKMDVKIEKTDDGDGMLFVSGYDSSRQQDYSVSMMLSGNGEREIDYVNNYEDSSVDYYIGITGDADYDMEIVFIKDEGGGLCCASSMAIVGALIVALALFTVLLWKKK